MNRQTVWCLLLAGLAGCAAAPSVKYVKYEPKTENMTPDLSGHFKFQLASSIALIKANVDAKTHDVSGLLFQSVPVEAPDGDVYGLVPDDSPGVTSNIGMEFRENTRLIKKVTTNLEDKRVDLIKQVGGGVAALVGVLGASATGKIDSTFSGTIDFAHLFADTTVETRDRIALDTEAQIKAHVGSADIGTGPLIGTINLIEVGPVPPDATSMADYPLDQSQGVLFLSSCRNAHIEVTVSGQKYAGTVTVADPNYVDTVAYPKVGSIEMHDACGASVTTGKSTTSNAVDLVTALIQQVKTVRDAQKKNAK